MAECGRQHWRDLDNTVFRQFVCNVSILGNCLTQHCRVYEMLWQKEGLLLDGSTTKGQTENVVYFPVGDAAYNSKGKIRAQRIGEGKKVSLISNLNVSLFNQEKLLPPNLQARISLTKNYSEFILLSAAADTSKVVFDNVILRCTFQRPVDMMLNLIEERLAQQNAIYHADKRVLSFHSISEGATEFTINNIFNGILPYCFLIGVQDRAAFGRTRTKNPYSLHPIHKIQLFIDGQDFFPRPIARTNTEFAVMYDTFLQQVGYPNNGDILLHSSYPAHPAMAFDLTADKTRNQQSLNLVKSGTARLTLGFGVPAPANQVLMVLAWYEQIIEITKDREITII